MEDRWFPHLKLPISFEEFLALPRNPTYKYEYFDGTAWLSPRPKTYHALLDLRPAAAPAAVDAHGPVGFRPLAEGDWDHLPTTFAAAFHRIQPFASLDEAHRLEAARSCLDRTRTGHDGPLVDLACFVALGRDDQAPLGGVLVTLIPDGDLTEFGAATWRTPPPRDCLARRLGRPHLTWIFVRPWQAGHGVGTALLALANNALLALGYRELASTFLLGNDSSTLWHWRNGFRLLAYPGSQRLWRERLTREREEEA